MNCPFCKNLGSIRLNSTFKLWWCNCCRAQFSNSNGELDFIIIYYKNFRIFYTLNSCILQMHTTFNNKWEAWQTICPIQPDIIKLSTKQIYYKIDSIYKLLPFF